MQSSNPALNLQKSRK